MACSGGTTTSLRPFGIIRIVAGAKSGVFRELHRVLRPGGHVAFEVGEVRNGKVKLEEAVLPCGVEAGLQPVLVLINDQKFSKTAQCWGISGSKGTNTNRIVIFRKPSDAQPSRDPDAQPDSCLQHSSESSLGERPAEIRDEAIGIVMPAN